MIKAQQILEWVRHVDMHRNKNGSTVHLYNVLQIQLFCIRICRNIYLISCSKKYTVFRIFTKRGWKKILKDIKLLESTKQLVLKTYIIWCSILANMDYLITMTMWNIYERQLYKKLIIIDKNNYENT